MSAQLQRMIDQRTPAGWKIEFTPYGTFEASHDDYEIYYEGEEDGWGDNGLCCIARSLEQVLSEIEHIEAEHPHFEEQRRENGQFGVGA